MIKCFSLVLILLISSCASFDRTNILPDQRVPGLGFSFSVPTEKAWSAVEYGTSNKIHLFQLNDLDNYSIRVSLNRGPRYGMYQNAEMHLRALKFSKQMEFNSPSWLLLSHDEWLEPKYGKLCVGYSYQAEDWHGRTIQGPITVDLIGLACEHQEMRNVIISIEFSRRSEPSANRVDIKPYAEKLFSSFEYHSVEGI
jgi:hypothetical protein